ncbi:sugar ABC transporter ATP-binding protein [Caproiciproducens sp. CPB-2]|uniref:sugar ABC transporter ATP-binding protein n=1 Tax=Caproiciproducens sp. CPB-2 TaxID=3030017 RepID=UPI0023DBF1F4|nr:sugar ABC transporter ATP-binding protein [Caproiciproducens sp. CPB-2]MDF1496404.1 sugar ABC transporter ATP-binding protein [Caproiciproducens sp. CPB-2]
MMDEYILQMENINKAFPGVRVLHDVSFSVKQGEVHALMGENGAGKSTLMKILGGIYSMDSGKIKVNGEDALISCVADAQKYGVSLIHQEICLANNLSIAENIFMGREITGKVKGFLDFKTMVLEAQKILDSLNMKIDARTHVGRLSIAQQQMVEICRALSTNARIIVMDEPTASLSNTEIENLFLQIQKLKAANVAIIYISHRMDEIFKIADTITVLRDGERVGSMTTQELSPDTLIKMMVGRGLKEVFQKVKLNIGEDLLRVEGFNNQYLKNVHLNLRKGEILGISGLVGAGRTELARAIFGIDPLDSGKIFIDGKEVKIRCPQDAIQHGIALVPESRKEDGLFLNQTISFNTTISILEKFIRFIHTDHKKENEILDNYINTFSIKMSSRNQLALELSGGNQQKIVISKWLATEPKILILDEPTRGIDVGAKAEIYQMMYQIAQYGVSIILISSELPEIINLSSRVAVMHEGELVKIIDVETEEISQEKIMYYAAGGWNNENSK